MRHILPFLFHLRSGVFAACLGVIAYHQYHEDPCICHALAALVTALSFAVDMVREVFTRNGSPPVPPAPGNWEVMRYDERDAA